MVVIAASTSGWHRQYLAQRLSLLKSFENKFSFRLGHGNEKNPGSYDASSVDPNQDGSLPGHDATALGTCRSESYAGRWPRQAWSGHNTQAEKAAVVKQVATGRRQGCRVVSSLQRRRHLPAANLVAAATTTPADRKACHPEVPGSDPGRVFGQQFSEQLCQFLSHHAQSRRRLFGVVDRERQRRCQTDAGANVDGDANGAPEFAVAHGGSGFA